jgi:hypothetical protein
MAPAPAPNTDRSLPDSNEEQARAFAAVASMIAWNLEVACRLAKPIDPALHRLLSDAYARALQVMTEQRASWRDLRKQRLR